MNEQNVDETCARISEIMQQMSYAEIQGVLNEPVPIATDSKHTLKLREYIAKQMIAASRATYLNKETRAKALCLAKKYLDQAEGSNDV